MRRPKERALSAGRNTEGTRRRRRLYRVLAWDLRAATMHLRYRSRCEIQRRRKDVHPVGERVVRLHIETPKRAAVKLNRHADPLIEIILASRCIEISSPGNVSRIRAEDTTLSRHCSSLVDDVIENAGIRGEDNREEEQRECRIDNERSLRASFGSPKDEKEFLPIVRLVPSFSLALRRSRQRLLSRERNQSQRPRRAYLINKARLSRRERIFATDSFASRIPEIARLATRSATSS